MPLYAFLYLFPLRILIMTLSKQPSISSTAQLASQPNGKNTQHYAITPKLQTWGVGSMLLCLKDIRLLVEKSKSCFPYHHWSCPRSKSLLYVAQHRSFA